MTYVRNDITGEIRYVTRNWARWLKAYGWLDATFDEFMSYQLAKYNLEWRKAVESSSETAY